MKLFETIRNGKVYFIAEMSANHNNKIENALKLVDEAKRAGADCFKTQTYTADSLTLDCDNEIFTVHGGLWDGCRLYDLYKEASTPREWQPIIKEKCYKLGIDFLSTPFDKSSVDFLESIDVDFYKIASFELIDIPLIEYTASKGKPMIISCGLGSFSEIQSAVDICKANKVDFVLLKCCSEYPARYENMNLSTIPDMINKFGCSVGFSDHSLGIVASTVAVSLGACVIEKHLCLSRDIQGPDSKFSMQPDEYSQMVSCVNQAVELKGTPTYGPCGNEFNSMIFRRSIFATRAIKAGCAFTAENIRCLRPNKGLHPKYFHKLLTHTAAKDIACGEPLTADMVKNFEE